MRHLMGIMAIPHTPSKLHLFTSDLKMKDDDDLDGNMYYMYHGVFGVTSGSGYALF